MAEDPHPALLATVNLLGFFSKSVISFGDALKQGVEKFALTGELPEHVYFTATPPGGAAADDAKGKKRGKKDKDKPKRAPTAYNVYMKEKIAALRGHDQPGENEQAKEYAQRIFLDAVNSWKALTEQQKRDYADAHKALPKDGEAEATPDGAAAAAAADLPIVTHAGAADLEEDDEDEDDEEDSSDSDEEEVERVTSPAKPTPAKPTPAKPTPTPAAAPAKAAPTPKSAPKAPKGLPQLQPLSEDKQKKRKKAPAAAPAAAAPAAAAAAPAATEDPQQKKKQKKKKARPEA